MKAKPCVEWSGANNGRYGMVWKEGRYQYAHRVAYEQAFGAIPDGMLVCHRCDNPPCIEPKHLFVGTSGDNARDAAAKGRTASHRRLSAADHAVIAARVRAGEFARIVAGDYGITRSYANMIARHG